MRKTLVDFVYAEPARGYRERLTGTARNCFMNERQGKAHDGSPICEPLENRRMLYASIPAGYTALETVQIRNKTGTYSSGLTLDKGTSYFIRASAQSSPARKFHSDAAFMVGTTPVTTGLSTTIPPVAAPGVVVVAGSTAAPGFGAFQSDHVYGQTIMPTAPAPLSFTYTADTAGTISTLAVTVYAAVPAVRVATVRTNRATGSIAINTLPATGVSIPLNNADFDHNGVADDKQPGAVHNDGFLLPITLPKVTGATKRSHYVITVPKSLRVWLNPDRSGSAAGIGIRETINRTVYLEARSELPVGTVENVRIAQAYDGATIVQNLRVTPFAPERAVNRDSRREGDVRV